MPYDLTPHRPAERQREIPRGSEHGRTRSLGAAVVLALVLGALTASTALGANPAQFTITTSQQIAGSAGPFMTSPLKAKLGQSVDYETVVKDTGTTTLALSGFIDKGCQGIAGGPSGALAPGESTTYTCQHLLSKFGEYKNHATVTATPPSGQGLPLTHSSKPVAVSVPAEPALTIEALQSSAGPTGPPYISTPIVRYGLIIYYKVIVTDTGNTKLKLSNFTDREHEILLIREEEATVPCEEVTGGSTKPLLPSQQTTYMCLLHVPLDVLKQPEVGNITSTAAITGTPPTGQGTAITNTSNELVGNYGDR